MATATMRLSVTIGPGATRSSSPYRPRIWRQSVSSKRVASSCTAAIAACSWYGPIGALASVSVISAMPSAMACAVPRAAVLFGERDQGAVRARFARGGARRSAASARAARRPRRRRAAGRAPAGSAGSPRAVSSTRCSDEPELAVEPSLKIRYRTCSTDAMRSDRSARGGIRNSAPLSRMSCFARLMRCADGLLGDQEGAGDLGRGQPADGPQGQGDLGDRRERRVAAQQQQRERVVDRARRRVRARGRRPRRRSLPDAGGPTRCATSRSVDETRP